MTYQIFRSFPQNTAGRDFVLGDIHGAYDSVLEGMKQVSFDSRVDRIFSVGDLIDRGPGSHRVDRFLDQPYVFAVAGNHDRDLTSVDLNTIRALGKLNWNGMGWVNDVSDEKLLEIRRKLAQLPVAIEVQTSRGKVGLVHGDIPAKVSWQAFVAALEKGDESVIEVALTGRNRIQNSDHGGVPGIGRVFVGHTVQWSGCRRLGNVYAIDTGAVFRELEKERGELSMMNIACRTESIADRRAQIPAGQELTVERASPGYGEFGRYCAMY